MKNIFKIALLSSLLSVVASAALVNETTNVREKPSIKSEVINTLQKDTQVEVLQKVFTKNDGTWYQLQNGYVSIDLLSLTPNELEKKIYPRKYQNNNYTSSDGYQFNDDKTKISTVFIIPNTKKTPEPIIEEPTLLVASIDTNNSNTIEDLPAVVKEDLNTTEPILVVQEETNPSKEIETNYDYFVGVSLNLNNLSASQSNSNAITLAENLDDSSTSFEIEIGTTLQDKYIVSANYEVLNLDNIKLQSYFLSLDYKFDHFLNPYLGVSLGNTDLSWQVDPLNTSTNRDYKASSLLLGIQAGIIYPLNNRWSVYSQASYHKLNLDTNLNATTTSNTKVSSTISHEDKKAIGVGVRYFF